MSYGVYSQGFGALYSWIGEEQAIELLYQNVSTFDNPGIKYIAATSLEDCSLRVLLDALVHVFAFVFFLSSYTSPLSMLMATLNTAFTDSSFSADFAFSILSTALNASSFISAIAVFLRT